MYVIMILITTLGGQIKKSHIHGYVDDDVFSSLKKKNPMSIRISEGETHEINACVYNILRVRLCTMRFTIL